MKLRGEELMEFVYINMIDVEGEIILLSPSLKERAQFALLKWKIERLKSKTRKNIKRKKFIDSKTLRSLIGVEDNPWDILLHLFIIRHVLAEGIKSNRKKHNVSWVLTGYSNMISEWHKLNSDVLTLSVRQFEVQTDFDLIQYKAW